ncbi:MAG: hypothetical protein AAB384_03325 [Patescibacteria group bacterium]
MQHQHPSGPEMLNDPGRMVQFCPMCDAEFNPMSARILAESGQGTLMHITCRNCRHAVVTIVTVTPQGVSTFGFITDAAAEDATRMLGAAPVSVDDVIEVHQQLTKSIQFAKALTK